MPGPAPFLADRGLGAPGDAGGLLDGTRSARSGGGEAKDFGWPELRDTYARRLAGE